MALFRFLGSGSSLGVPVIGCKCLVCQSGKKKNERLRSSALVHIQGKKWLIDAGPDLRRQALLYGIDWIDGILLTHAHYDHVGGLDELRVYNFLQKQKIPCLLSKETKEDLQKRHYYLFEPSPEEDRGVVRLDFQEITQDFGSCIFGGLPIQVLSFFQGGIKVHGFRLQSLAYVSDIREYKEEVFSVLQGVKVLIVSALRQTASAVHFSLQEGIEFAKKVGASSTYFTHIAHEVDYEEVSRKLPKGVFLAYDGLEVAFDYEA